jgi:hypothetical protein
VEEIKLGQIFTYDDGRPGHRGIKAKVVALTDNGFIAQFEDRYDTTAIAWNEPEWISHITFEK